MSEQRRNEIEEEKRGEKGQNDEEEWWKGWLRQKTTKQLCRGDSVF